MAAFTFAVLKEDLMIAVRTCKVFHGQSFDFLRMCITSKHFALSQRASQYSIGVQIVKPEYLAS